MQTLVPLGLTGRSKIRRMSALDASMIHMESHEAPQHASILITFKLPTDAPPDYMRDLFQQMRECPVTAEPFNYVLTPGWSNRIAPSWTVLPSHRIDVDFHLRHSALPDPGGELELGVLVSRLATHPVDLTRPPWEVHLIEGLAGGRFALYMKLHHAVMDGTGAQRMLLSWLSADSAVRGIKPLWAHEVPRAAKDPAKKKSPPRSPLEIVGASVAGALPALTEVAKATQKSLGVALGLSDEGLVAPYTAPRTIFNRAITQRRRVSTQRLELARVKAIAEQIGGTVNDAIAVLLGGALRRYLLELDALPDQSCTASVLVSLHGKAAESGKDRSGNVISLIFADLATETEDVRQRAERVCASTTAGKDHLLGMSGSAPMAYTGLMMAPVIAANVLRKGQHLPPLSTIGLSNVPGPRQPVYLNGAEAEGLHATTILWHGQAGVVTVMNWNEHLCFTITGCPDTVPQCQRIAVYLEDELVRVEKAFGL